MKYQIFNVQQKNIKFKMSICDVLMMYRVAQSNIFKANVKPIQRYKTVVR